MRRPRSLAGSLIQRILMSQLALISVLGIIIPIWIDPVQSPIYYWWANAAAAVQASLTQSPDGQVTIQPSPALRALATANPGLQYAVIARPSGRVIPGSSPELVAVVAPPGHVQIENLVFSAPEDLSGTPLEGGAQTVSSPSGTFTIFIYGIRNPRVGDYLDFWRAIFIDVAEYAVPALGFVALVAWLVVRRSMRPLRQATAGIAALGFDNPGTRLPDDDRIPSELLPLIQGINRALDRLQDGFRRQQRFTANAAHEMRTPLAVLRARIDSLEPIPAQEELRRDAQRITALVDQMLAIVRLQRNDDPFEDFNLGELVAALTIELAPLAIGVDLQITYVPPARPVRVRGNRRAIETAVTNLIDNALHAEPAGGSIAVAVTEDGAVLIIDHGPGIAPEHRDLVFEPFWRQDESRAGSGLGLAIVREIAELHGGTVRTTETFGGGATFRFQLPVLPG